MVLADGKNGQLYISIMEKKEGKKSNLPWQPPVADGAGAQDPSLGKSLPYRAAWDIPHDLSIPHVYEKSIHEYPDLEISITDITPENRKDKFAKAVRAVSRHLHVPVSIAGKDGKNRHAGEPYLYPVQQELSDRWAGYYKNLIQKVYDAAVLALGLPPVAVETMNKAVGGNGALKYRGRIVYNPETGQPLKNKDFDRLIEAIQNFLNRNTKDLSKQILLDSAAIGKLLHRLAKYQSSADMGRLKLDGLEYRGRDFTWIRDDIKNLATALGEPLTGPEMARYQVGQDYIGHLVSRSNKKIREEIQDTVLRGIVDRRTKAQVSQDLFNRMGSLNRDWRRIADTEIVNTSNLARMLEDVNHSPEGEKVYFRRYELPGCCDRCAKADGVIALWSDTPLGDDRIKDPYAKVAVWEGKPQEKGRTALVTGTLHPNCRGGWLRWGGSQADEMTAQIRGRAGEWDAAVSQAREEWREKGIENPDDQTAGYAGRISDLYRARLGGGE